MKVNEGTESRKEVKEGSEGRKEGRQAGRKAGKIDRPVVFIVEINGLFWHEILQVRSKIRVRRGRRGRKERKERK